MFSWVCIYTITRLCKHLHKPKNMNIYRSYAPITCPLTSRFAFWIQLYTCIHLRELDFYHVYIYICVRAPTWEYVYIRVFFGTSVYIYGLIFIFTWTCIYIYPYAYMGVMYWCTHACICVYIGNINLYRKCQSRIYRQHERVINQMYIYIYIYIYIHISIFVYLCLYINGCIRMYKEKVNLASTDRL